VNHPKPGPFLFISYHRMESSGRSHANPPLLFQSGSSGVAGVGGCDLFKLTPAYRVSDVSSKDLYSRLRNRRRSLGTSTAARIQRAFRRKNRSGRTYHASTPGSAWKHPPVSPLTQWATGSMGFSFVVPLRIVAHLRPPVQTRLNPPCRFDGRLVGVGGRECRRVPSVAPAAFAEPVTGGLCRHASVRPTGGPNQRVCRVG
jgi:hypothetical protein